jgi:hypothetical protein
MHPGCPRIPKEIENLILRFARENRTWGYDRIAGALFELGHTVSDQTVGNILKRRRYADANRPQLNDGQLGLPRWW